MRRTLLVVAVVWVLLAAAAAKWLSGLAVEAKVDPGEVPGEIAVYLEAGTARPKGVAEVHRLPDTSFRDYEECCAFKSPQGPIWLRFKVTNAAQQLDSLHYSFANERFTVELVNPFVPRLTFYQLDAHGGITDSITTGVAGRHYRDRPYSEAHARNFRFPIVLPQDSSAWVYLRVEADMPLTFRVLFFKESDRLGHQQWMVDMMFAVFFVFCMLFLGLSAILIAVSREHFNWYYFFYILVTTLFIQAHIGWGFVHIWPSRPEWQAVVPMGLNTLRLVFGIQFFRRYFDLPRSSPRFDPYVWASLRVFLVTLALQLIVPLFGFLGGSTIRFFSFWLHFVARWSFG
jgi:7TMR-DISM extracellular 2./7TM diverse intracellular signalling.